MKPVDQFLPIPIGDRQLLAVTAIMLWCLLPPMAAGQNHSSRNTSSPRPTTPHASASPSSPTHSSPNGSSPRRMPATTRSYPAVANQGSRSTDPNQTRRTARSSQSIASQPGFRYSTEPRTHSFGNATPIGDTAPRETTRAAGFQPRSASVSRQVETPRPSSGRIEHALENQPKAPEYVQRSFASRGTEYFRRSYKTSGHSYTAFYVRRSFSGRVYPVYVPARYYRPTFYGYAYRAWPRPITYHWGWYLAAWYGYYGPVFAPYTYYASPTAWLTDYILSSELQEAFDSQPERDQVISNGTPITPEIKEGISQEVQRQLEQYQQGPPPDPKSGTIDTALPIFDKAAHTLLVANSVIVLSGNQPCAITKGDVLRLSGTASADPAAAVPVTVIWSQPPDCAIGSTVMVAVDQLQEMQNEMRAKLDRGLEAMQGSSGRDGMVDIPRELLGETASTFVADAPRTPEPNTMEELKQHSYEDLEPKRQRIP